MVTKRRVQSVVPCHISPKEQSKFFHSVCRTPVMGTRDFHGLWVVPALYIQRYLFRNEKNNGKILKLWEKSAHICLYLSSLRVSLRVLRLGLICSIGIRAWISRLFFHRPVAFCLILVLSSLNFIKEKFYLLFFLLYFKWDESAQNTYRSPV